MKFVTKFNGIFDTITEKYNKVILVFIFAIAAFVRLWKFGIIPGGFNQDEALASVESFALLKHGTDRLGMPFPAHFTSYGYSPMNVLYSYVNIPFVSIFGLNRVSSRLPVVILSLIALVVLYFLCKLTFDKKVAITIFAFCSIAPWNIMQSRWALDNFMLPYFFLFSVFFLALGFYKNKKIIYISMIFFGITMYSYAIAWYAVPLFLCIVCFFALRKKLITFLEAILYAIVYMLVAFPIFGTAIINAFKLKTIYLPFVTIPFFPDSVRSKDVLFFSDNIPKQLLSNIKSFIDIVIYQTYDMPWNTVPGFGSIYIFSIPFVLVGLFAILKMELKTVTDDKENVGYNVQFSLKSVLAQNNRGIIIVCWLIVSIFVGMITANVNVNRINIIFYPMIILCGIGIYSIIKRIKIFSILILLIYAIAVISFSSNYFGDHSKVIASSFYNGFEECSKYVEGKNFEKLYVTSDTQYDNSWIVSEVLVMFHLKIDALYYQGKKDEYSKSGVKLLPYKQRFKYVQYKNTKLDPQENALYIAKNSELSYFDTSKYKILNFKDYNVIIPLK